MIKHPSLVYIIFNDINMLFNTRYLPLAFPSKYLSVETKMLFELLMYFNCFAFSNFLTHPQTKDSVPSRLHVARRTSLPCGVYSHLPPCYMDLTYFRSSNCSQSLNTLLDFLVIHAFCLSM